MQKSQVANQAAIQQLNQNMQTNQAAILQLTQTMQANQDANRLNFT